MLYFAPLISTQTFPVLDTLRGMLIVSVGPTFSVNVDTLLARFVSLIVLLGSIVILNVWLPTVETHVKVVGAVAPAPTEICTVV
jgi:hypothetical protein